MRTGKQPGKNAGVRCVGDRAWSEGLSEANSIFRQTVECRRVDIRVAIAVDVISSQSVDGDQENIRLSRFRLRESIRTQGRKKKDRKKAEEQRKMRELHGHSD